MYEYFEFDLDSASFEWDEEKERINFRKARLATIPEKESMSMVKMSMKDLDRTLSIEGAKELEAAERLHPVFDEDSPEMTADMLQQFKRMNQEERNKQTVSLRLSPKTLRIAKSYGKGYTSFLSRLLDEAIKDEALVRKCI